MISRLGISVYVSLPVAVLGAALFASPMRAQGRGMRASAAAPRTRAAFRSGFSRSHPRRFYNGGDYPYFYSDYDDDYEPVTPGEPGVRVMVVGPNQPTVAVPSPVEPLLMEYHNGQWVRIPNNGEMPTGPPSAQPDSVRGSNPQPGAAGEEEAAQATTELPPAVLAFRDGHREEIKKYTIKGNIIYASADYWSTGSWTREIPIAQLDIAATLKLNAERGGKFALPSGPDEIMLRF